MQTQLIYSSKMLLEQIQPAEENRIITEELMNEMQQEMQKKMESFDAEKQKTAQALEELSKLVITA